MGVGQTEPLSIVVGGGGEGGCGGGGDGAIVQSWNDVVKFPLVGQQIDPTGAL